MQRRLRLLILAALAAVAGGCGTMAIDPPAPFLVLQTRGRQLKAATPDDARLWIREFDDEHKGNLEFWSEALHHDLLGRGYRAAGEAQEVTDAAGTRGVVRTYELHAAGRPHGYMVALFVAAGSRAHTIRVAEFAAQKPRFDELVAAVRQSLATLDP